MNRQGNGSTGVVFVLRVLMFLCMSVFAVGASAQGLNTARFRVTATSGTDLVAPGNAALKIDMLDAIVNGVYESIDYSSIYLMRNGELVVMDINWDSPTTQYYSEQGLAAGTYDFIVMGVAISHDAMGNERYREVQSSPVRFTVTAPSGWLVANPSSCVIPWGGSACSSTVSWSSNAASAQVFLSSPSGASPVVIAQGASGSQAVSITAAGARLSLRDGPYVLANIDVAGVPTQNQAPQVSLVAPAAHAVIPVGTAAAMQAAASDPDDGIARVEFLVDGQQVGVSTSAPYAVNVTVGAGTHTLVARATDTRGAQVDSAAVPFFMALPPSVSITSPVPNSIRREPGSFVLAAAASDPDGTIQKVEYLANGALVATATSSPFSASANGLSAGAYSIVARATDNHGLSATSSPVSVSVFASSDGGAGQSLTRRYTYNAQHLLCRVEEPETGVTLMGYDPAGNLAWSAAGLSTSAVCEGTGGSAEAGARRVARSYDARGRLSSLSFPDGKGDQVWTYTADGKPSSITVANPGAAATTVSTYAYNRRRMLTEESLRLPDGRTWSAVHSYDAQGNRSSLRYPATGLTVDYSPNALGQPTRAGNFVTGAQWHPNGSIKQFAYGNGVVRTVAQNARQLPARVSDCVGSTGCTGAGTRIDLSYAYDAAGNPVEIADLRNGRQGRSMEYDSADRLTHVNSQMFGEAFYEYDPFDNLRLNVVAAGSNARAHHYCYDAQWRLTNVKVGGCGGATVIGLSYDVQGNLHHKNGQEYQFDFGNRLREVVGKESYSYDGHGRRVLSCDGSGCSSQMYSVDGKLLYTEDARKGVATEHIQLGDGLVALHETAAVSGVVSTRYQHADLLGSPIAETDSAGSLSETLEYEPYGQQINSALRDRPGYAGHMLDAATGLSYMQQRYMDPQLGVFLSVDPVTAYEQPVGQFNRYRYASSNPYTFTDPDGRQSRGNVSSPSTGVPFFDWLMSPSDARTSAGQMAGEQLATELSQPHSTKDVVLYTAIAMSAGIGAGAGGRAMISAEARVGGAEGVAEMSGMLRDAARGKGNFGIGNATSEQADVMGRAWVGPGASQSSTGNALISRDGLRQYRFPSEKRNSPHASTGVQANFESRPLPDGKWINNAHLNVEKIE